MKNDHNGNNNNNNNNNTNNKGIYIIALPLGNKANNINNTCHLSKWIQHEQIDTPDSYC